MPGPPAKKTGSKQSSAPASSSEPKSGAQSFSGGRRATGPVSLPPPPPPGMLGAVPMLTQMSGSAPLPPPSFESPPLSQWAAFSQACQENSTTQGSPPLSAFEQKLEENPPCSIESLLDEEEILQEFRRGNECLLQRLTAYEGMRVLIEQVTRGPKESDGEETNSSLRRRPWVVSELLSSGSDTFFDAFRQPGGSDLLDLVWSFLESTPEPVTAAVLAGYFCTTVATLLAQCTVEVAEHLRRRDPSHLFDLILQQIESRSFVDLFITLLCVEVPEHVVFPIDGLAWRLVTHLLKEDGETSVLEHIVLVIEALIVRACAQTLHASGEILQQFSDEKLLVALLEQAFGGVSAHACSSSSVASVTVLSIIVSHMHSLPSNPLLPVRSPDFRPAPPTPRSVSTPLPAEVIDQSFKPDQGCREPEEDVSEDMEKPPAPRKVWEDVSIESSGVAVADVICSNLPRLCSILDAPDATVEPKAASITCTRPISAIMLEVVGLIAYLASTHRPKMLEAALHAAILPRCLQAIFRYPWHTLLHNAATSVFRELLRCGSEATQILMDLSSRADLLERVVDEVRHDARVRQCQTADIVGQQSLPRQRVGYVGHLRIICQELAALSVKCPEVTSALEAIAGWSDTVLPELEAWRILTSENSDMQSPVSPEGSRLKSEFDCMSAVQTFMASLTDEVDLNLEDLRDLDEELDTDVAIAMAAAHAKQRSRGGAVCPTPPMDDDTNSDEPSVSQEESSQDTAAESSA